MPVRAFRQTCLALIAAGLSLAATAAPLTCPELATTVQVNGCPTEDELQFTYTGYCSDNAKAYAKETDSCIRYEDYRQMKNVALWESQDGEFAGYVSCNQPAEQLKRAPATAMQIERLGKLTKLVCSYGNGIKLTYRTKGSCTLNDDKACAANAANCQARCD